MNAAVKRSEDAGKQIAKLGALRGLAMKARESATADEKTALQTKISDYEA